MENQECKFRQSLSELLRLSFTSENTDTSHHSLTNGLFTSMVENAPIGFYIVEDGKYVYTNKLYASMMGYTKEALRGMCIEQVIHPEDYATIRPNMLKREKRIAEEDTRYQVRKYKKDGSVIFCELHSGVTYIEEKSLLYGTVIDITKQVLAQQALAESEAHYKSLFLSSPDVIFSLDLEGRFTSVNPTCEKITGYTIKELVGTKFYPLVKQEYQSDAMLYFEKTVNGESSQFPLVISKKDGIDLHLQITQFPIEMNGVIVGMYGTAKDISESVAYKKKIEQFTLYDSLTNLPNRKFLENRLERLIQFSNEFNSEFSIVSVNLNRFHFINDSLGYHVGDQIIKKVASSLQSHLRKYDTISRLAGDEFVLVYPNTTESEVHLLIHSISNAINQPLCVFDTVVNISANIGVAVCDGKEQNAKEAIRKANIAMQHAKKSSNQSYAIYSIEMDRSVSYQMKIEHDLIDAIKKDEFELYYQPIIELKKQQVVSVEALLRWNHPELGFISPSDFIPIAEKSGLIIPIGEWVIRTACKQMHLWENVNKNAFKIAINISTKQLYDRQFVDKLKRIFSEEKVKPSIIEFEITESMILDDENYTKDMLFQLKEVGVSLSIDDFGTGYTSLNYLRQYPFDKVKIDRSFIDDITCDANGKQITSSIISLAHNLHMIVTAEGIENDSQMKFLQQEGCDTGQGYFIHKPMPASSFVQLLN